MPKLEPKPLSFFKPDLNQPRKHFDEDELRLLGESLPTVSSSRFWPVMTVRSLPVSAATGRLCSWG